MKAMVLVALLVALFAPLPAAGQQPPDLRGLITAAEFIPWSHRQPEPLELSDESGLLRSLSRDFAGKIVVIFGFAEG